MLSRENGNSLGSSIDAGLLAAAPLMEGAAFFRLRQNNITKHNPNSTKTVTTTAATIIPVLPPLAFSGDVGNGVGLPEPAFDRGDFSDKANGSLEGIGRESGTGAIEGLASEGDFVGSGFGEADIAPHLGGILSTKMRSAVERALYLLTTWQKPTSLVPPSFFRGRTYVVLTLRLIPHKLSLAAVLAITVLEHPSVRRV